MAVLALIAWIVTAMAGLYLLSIWLIEYDPDFQHAAATRLPVPVVCGHVLLAVGGLVLWVMYLVTDKKIYCWTTAGVLGLIAALGFTMAVRWFGVYRFRPGQAPAPAVPMPDAPSAYSPAGQATIPGWAADSSGYAGGQARPGGSPFRPNAISPSPWLSLTAFSPSPRSCSSC